MDESNLNIEILSDPTLKVTTALVGTMDLSQFLWEKKKVNIGSYEVPVPGIVVIGDDGLLLSRIIFPSPGLINFTRKRQQSIIFIGIR